MSNTDTYLAKLEEENENLRLAFSKEKKKSDKLLADIIEDDENAPLNRLGLILIKKKLKYLNNCERSRSIDRSIAIDAGRGMGHTTLAKLIKKSFSETYIINPLSVKDKDNIRYHTFLSGHVFRGMRLSQPIIVFDDCVYRHKEQQEFNDAISSIDSASAPNIPLLVFLGNTCPFDI